MSKLDKYDINKIREKKTSGGANLISVGVTWVDGRIMFKPNTKGFDKQGQAWYGICHFSQRIFLYTPRDYERPTMITTIMVSPTEDYCERAYSCLDFACQLNKFNKGVFSEEFKDCNELSLGLPRKVGEGVLWFNSGEWTKFWGYLILHGDGGILRYDEKKAKEIFKNG